MFNMMHMCNSNPNLWDSPEAGRFTGTYLSTCAVCSKAARVGIGSFQGLYALRPGAVHLHSVLVVLADPGRRALQQKSVNPKLGRIARIVSRCMHACNATHMRGTSPRSVSTGTWADVGRQTWADTGRHGQADVPAMSMTPCRPYALASFLPGRPGGHPTEAVQPAPHSISRA